MRISSCHTISLLTCIVVAVYIPLVSGCTRYSWINPSILYEDAWDDHEYVCGTESENGRIAFGNNVGSVNTWPFLARLSIDTGNGIALCSAEIVAKRFVTTAAHCVTKDNGDVIEPDKLTLTFATTERNIGGVTRKVELIFRHHEYLEASIENDIAILKLFDTEPLVYGSSCRPVCLPVPNEDYFDFSNCWAVGWGLTEKGTVADTLQELKMKLITPSECNLRRVNAGKSAIRDSHICAVDAVNALVGHTWGGDSGGPLMCKHDNHLTEWILIGINSFDSKPDVFAKVAKFSQWISDCINAYGGPGPF